MFATGKTIASNMAQNVELSSAQGIVTACLERLEERDRNVVVSSLFFTNIEI